MPRPEHKGRIMHIRGPASQSSTYSMDRLSECIARQQADFEASGACRPQMAPSCLHMSGRQSAGLRKRGQVIAEVAICAPSSSFFQDGSGDACLYAVESINVHIMRGSTRAWPVKCRILRYFEGSFLPDSPSKITMPQRSRHTRYVCMYVCKRSSNSWSQARRR